MNIEDKEQVDQTGGEVAGRPDETESCGGLTSKVLDELGEEDEEPDGIGNVATSVCEDTKGHGEVWVAVLS